MTEKNPEESFTFVDKRKISGAETPEVSPDEPVESTVEAVDEPISDQEQQDPGSTYGLTAYVTGLIASDAWQKMGLIPDPSSGKIRVDLEQSRFGIDCVAALVGVMDSHKEAVPQELLRDLQRVLSDLRLNYVEQARRNQSP